MQGYFPLYASNGDDSIPELPTDPPHATLEKLAILEDGEQMREALLLDILGEIKALYPHHQLTAVLTPMDMIGQPIVEHRILPLRQGTVQIVERP
jgi:hypothetical protein